MRSNDDDDLAFQRIGAWRARPLYPSTENGNSDRKAVAPGRKQLNVSPSPGIDAAAAALLQRHGWQAPPSDQMPCARDLHERYLAPLAATPEMAAIVETDARVTAISRQGIDKVGSKDRETRPFVLRIASAGGTRRELARAIIDASGTSSQPEGEAEHADRIA